MAEFVNLNDTNEAPEIIPYNPTALELITPDSEVINGDITKLYVLEYLTDPEAVALEVLTINNNSTEPDEIDDDCDTCNPADFYGDTNPDASFKRNNLFSELTSDYERAVARRNLGVSEEYSLVWGNISGNFRHQEDLYNFILESTTINTADLISEINIKLAQWGYNIRVSLDSKASIDSPVFSGIPIVPSPNLNDSSNQIPTTEWVNRKLTDIGITPLDLKFFSLNYTTINIGDPAVDLIASWEYNAEIEAQFINGVSIDITQRSYTFPNTSSTKTVTLSYIIDGITFQKGVLFEVITPIYYGTSSSFLQVAKTSEKEFILNCGNSGYGYVYIPGITPARISMDNFIGGFIIIGTVIIYNVVYTLYKTMQSGLGQLYITIL